MACNVGSISLLSLKVEREKDCNVLFSHRSLAINSLIPKNVSKIACTSFMYRILFATDNIASCILCEQLRTILLSQLVLLSTINLENCFSRPTGKVVMLIWKQQSGKHNKQNYVVIVMTHKTERYFALYISVSQSAYSFCGSASGNN